MFDLTKWPIGPEQITALVSRRSGGAKVAPRVTLWTEQLIGNRSVLTATATAVISGDPKAGYVTTLTLPLPTGMSGWQIGERIVVGTPPNIFDAGILQSYNPSSGDATMVLPYVIQHNYTYGFPAYQAVPEFVPVNGYDFPPPGTADEHNSNDITQICNSMICSIDSTQSVSRDLKLNVIERDGFRYDPERYCLKLFCDFWDHLPAEGSGGNVMADVPVFHGYTVQPTKQIAAENGIWAVTAQDPTHKAAVAPFLNTFACPGGANIAGLIVDMLSMDFLAADPNLGALAGTGICPSGAPDAGPNIRFSKMSIPPTNSVLPYAFIFSVENTYKLDAMNALARVYNCWKLYSDAYGNVLTRPMPYYTDAVPFQAWAYQTDGDSIFIDPQTLTYPDIGSRPNAVTVITEPNGGTPSRATWYNTNPSSSNSVPRLNRIIGKAVRDDYIGDAAKLLLRAKLEVQLAAMQDPPLQVSHLVNPFQFDLYDGVMVNYASQHGVQIASSPNSLFICTAASMDFSSAPFKQSTTLQKVVFV